MTHYARVLPLLALLISACQALVAPTPTASPTATLLPSPTPLPSATATPPPSATPSSTPTPTVTPTLTPTATVTLTATITPTPTITPVPGPRFVYDNWQTVDVPPSLRDGIDSPMVAFINRNDRLPDYDVRTPRPNTNSQTVYFAAPLTGGLRLPVIQMNADTVSGVAVAPPGNGISWFVSEPLANAGIYLLDTETGISSRVLAIDSLLQRSIASDVRWAPDGSRLVLAADNDWGIDIFSIDRASGASINLTSSQTRDFWPSLSPAGRTLLFVSDRARCPGGWQPGAPDGCDLQRDEVLHGGNPWLLDLASGELRRLSDRWVGEAPVWVNENLVSIAEGDLQRSVYLIDLASGQENRVHPLDAGSGKGSLMEIWSPDGSRVVLQDTSQTASVTTLLNARGQRVGILPRLVFPRFGMAAAWSPDGQRLALGGTNGYCPYGVRVLDAGFFVVASGSMPPGMCDPVYSRDGQLAFTGINPRIDGRIDVYAANRNGFGLRNLTGDLRGQIELLGWVGG